MKILFISPQPYPYGMAASKRIRLFAEYLVKQNTVKAFICGRNNADNACRGKKKGVGWEFIPFGRLEYFLNFVKVYKLLKRNFIQDEKNIIMLYDGVGLTNILFALIGRRIGYSIFTDIVEDYSVSQENESSMRYILLRLNVFIDKFIFGITDGIIVISKILNEKYKIGNTKYIPISAENLGIKFKRKGFDKFTYLYSGSFGVKDGVRLLIDAFSKFSIDKSDVQLLLSGTITNDIKKYLAQRPTIKYVGLVPDEDYYCFLKKADVLLMTRINSEYANSGFPFKLGEYLATANPVIATKVSNISDYVSDKKDVVLATPSDINSIISSFEFVYNNQVESMEIGKRGELIARKYFNPVQNGEVLSQFILKHTKE